MMIFSKLISVSKKLVTFGVILQLLIHSSCKEDDQPGYNQAINPLWEYNFNVGYSGSIIPIIHDNLILYSSLKETSSNSSANDKLIALDKGNGKLIWEWSDLQRDSYEHFDDDSNPLLGNILAMSTGSRNYAIDLSTGQTVWKNQTTPSFGNMSKYSSQIYRIDIYTPEDIGIYSQQIMEADISTGNWQKAFEVTGGDSLRQGLTVPTVYTDQGDEIMIVGNTTIIEKPGGYITPNLIRYDKTKGVIDYNVQLDEPSLYAAIDWFPIIDNNKVYLLVDKLIVCHELSTGNRIWERRFLGNFVFSGALLNNGRIYANSDGNDPTLYCINAETGSVIWQTPSAGTSSPLQLHKGVLYFVGGSTGLFNCVNSTTGKFIYSIKAPSQYKDHNDFFATVCTVDHDTDRAYVASFTRAYCYPTIDLK